MFKVSFWALTAFLLLVSSSATAQNIVISDVETSLWPEVAIKASLPSSEEHPEAYTLKILPDGAAVQATSVVPDEHPLSTSIIVALDTSKSMSPERLTAVKEALLRYVEQLGDDEQLALLAFNDNVQLIADFTTDRDLFKSTLDKLTLGGKNTELYRAMMYGIDRLTPVTDSRRILLLISDGKDEGEAVTESEVLAAAKEKKIQVLSIGLPNKRDKEWQKYQDILKNFAQDSSGQYRLAETSAELKLATYELLLEQRKIAAAERNKRFVLQFEVTSPPLATPTEASLTRKVEKNEETVRLTLPKVEQATESPVKEQLPPVEPEQSIPLWERGWFWACALGALILLVAIVVLGRKKSAQNPDQTPEDEKLASSGPDGKILHGAAPEKNTSFVLEFPKMGLTFPLAEGIISMGANAENHICVNEPTVSGSHAEFVVTAKECLVTDLNSTNGILLNGARINGQTALSPGDILLFGKAEAILRYVQPTGHATQKR